MPNRSIVVDLNNIKIRACRQTCLPSAETPESDPFVVVARSFPVYRPVASGKILVSPEDDMGTYQKP